MNFSKSNALSFLLGSMMLVEAAAFVSRVSVAPSRTKPLHLMNGEVAEIVSSSSAAFNNLLVATIDSDIANVPENEFAPIFAGGILVMFGGIMSALIVGFILESNDSYANVIADSYAQGAEDEEFWKGLSEEEQKKTRELLQKIKESKEDGAAAAAEALASVQEEDAAEAPAVEESTPTEPATPSAKAKDPGMFSDY